MGYWMLLGGASGARSDQCWLWGLDEGHSSCVHACTSAQFLMLHSENSRKVLMVFHLAYFFSNIEPLGQLRSFLPIQLFRDRRSSV